jgi:hypothetical protein
MIMIGQAWPGSAGSASRPAPDTPPARRVGTRPADKADKHASQRTGRQLSRDAGAVWESVSGATSRETRWRCYASGLRLQGMPDPDAVQVPRRLTPRFDDARTVCQPALYTASSVPHGPRSRPASRSVR